MASADAASSRSTIAVTILALVSFVALLAMALLAMTRMDKAFSEAQSTAQRVMRSILVAELKDTPFEADSDALFSALERIERIDVLVELDKPSAALSSLLMERRDSTARLAIVEQLVLTFDELDTAIVEKRQSIARSFHSLIGSLALCLIASILGVATLRSRLRVSRVETAWSQRSLRMSLAADEELRRRIARELHDDAAQDMAAAKMLCERAALAAGAAEAGGGAGDLSAQAAILLRSAGKKIRGLALDLRPPELERAGLAASIAALCARSLDGAGRAIRFEASDSVPPLSDETAIQAYRMIQEAIVNARKHAPMNSIQVTMGPSFEADGVSVVIRDYGDGLKSGPLDACLGKLDQSESSGMGMNIMRERAALAGGSIRFEADESGLLVKIFMPAIPPERKR